jgi:hypothetical protein
MTNNEFDKFFREQLKDHSAPVPEGLWEKIMPKDKKRPTAFYLPKNVGLGILIASLIIAGLYGGFKYEQATNNNLVNTNIDNNRKPIDQNIKNTNTEGIRIENTTNVSSIKKETNSTNSIVANNATKAVEKNL